MTIPSLLAFYLLVMNTVQNGKGSADRKGINYRRLRNNHDDISWPSKKKTKGATKRKVLDSRDKIET